MPDSEVPETHFCNNHRGCDYGEADLEALLKYRADCRGKANKRKYEQSDLGKATIPIRGTAFMRLLLAHGREAVMLR